MGSQKYRRVSIAAVDEIGVVCLPNIERARYSTVSMKSRTIVSGG